jgi:YD repeat-containing protein
MKSILKSFIRIFCLVSFALLIPSFAHAQTPLPCNQTVSDSISVVGETDEYTFDATAGDHVRINGLVTSGPIDLELHLYDPNGQSVAYTHSTSNPLLDVTSLPATGTYTLLVSDRDNNDTGTYSLRWDKVVNSCGGVTALPCNTIVSGNITDGMEEYHYTFDASAGERVRIIGKVTSGTIDLELRLYDPNGQFVTSGWSSTEKILEVTPSTTGTYTLLVYARYHGETGTYNLRWDKIINSCGGVTTLPCNTIVSGSITYGMEENHYTFDAVAGERVRVRGKVTSGPMDLELRLYDPNGQVIAYDWSSSNTNLDLTVSTTGTYTLLVYDRYHGETGNYDIILDRINNPCTSVTTTQCGQQVSGSIDDPMEADFYELTLDAPDTVDLRFTADITKQLAMYDSSGNRILNYNDTWVHVNVSIDAGTYYLVITDYNNNETGTYVLSWDRINNPCTAVTTTQCGQSLSGSIDDPMELDFYTLTANAGDELFISTAVTSGGIEPYMYLYDPTGSEIASGEGNTFSLLVADGQYTLTVYDYGNDEIGSYDIEWDRFNNPCNEGMNLPCGRDIPGDIRGLSQVDYYVFNAESGDKVRIVAADVLGGIDPVLLLYNPSEVQIASASGAPDTVLETTLPESGQYRLVVYDNGHNDLGSYSLRRETINNPCSVSGLSCGQTIQSTISTQGQEDLYSFTASAGDRVRIVIGDTTSAIEPNVLLYDTSGMQVASASGDNEAIIETTLSTNGQYLVIAHDSGHNETTAEYSLTWNRLNSPCSAEPINCGQTQPGSVDSIVESDFYTFQALAGDNIAMTMTVTSGGVDPQIELFDSTGTKVSAIYNAAGSQAILTDTISQDGTYFIASTDYSYDETGAYRLKFQKNDNACPEIEVLAPNGGETIYIGSSYTITWSNASTTGISSQDIRLSTDGGDTFPIVLTQGLPGSTTSYDWTPDIGTIEGRIRISAVDSSGLSTADDSDKDFRVLQPIVQNAETYGYDKLNRLIHVDNEDGSTIDYTYDGVGNRLTRALSDPNAEVTATPSIANFGDVFIDATSDITVTINNLGGSNINILSVSAPNNPFSIVDDTCSGNSVHQGNNCTITVRFSPIEIGQFSGSIRITSDSTVTPTVDVPLRGIGVPPHYTLIISKDGPGSGIVTSLDGGISCGAICSKVYDGGTSVELSASPDSGFAFQGWSGGGCSGTGDCILTMSLDTTVTATFSLAPDLEVTPSSHNYGNVLGGEVSLQVFIASNIGSADLIIEPLSIIGVDASEYTLGNDTCSNQTVVPTGSCTFDVEFEPTSVGSKTAGVEIISNDPSSPENVPLSGIGTSERNIVVRTALLNEDFESGIPADWTIVGQWRADNPCSRVIGSPFIDPWAIVDSACMSTSNDELLTPIFSSASCSDVDLLFSNQFDADSGSTASIDTSSDSGQTWADVNIVAADDGYPTPNWKEIDISGIAGYESAEVRFDYDATAGFWAIDNVWVLCQPAELHITGQVFKTSDPKTVMVTNKGFDEDLTIGTISITGGDSAEFSVHSDDCSGQLLTPDSDCTVSVVMTPLSMGSKSTTVNVTSDDPDTPTFSVPIYGEVTDLVDYSIFSTQLLSETAAESSGSSIEDVTGIMTDDALGDARRIETKGRKFDILSFRADIDAALIPTLTLGIYVPDLEKGSENVRIYAYQADGDNVQTTTWLDFTLAAGWNNLDVAQLLPFMEGFGFVKFRVVDVEKWSDISEIELVP